MLGYDWHSTATWHDHAPWVMHITFQTRHLHVPCVQNQKVSLEDALSCPM